MDGTRSTTTREVQLRKWLMVVWYCPVGNVELWSYSLSKNTRWKCTPRYWAKILTLWSTRLYASAIGHLVNRAGVLTFILLTTFNKMKTLDKPMRIRCGRCRPIDVFQFKIYCWELIQSNFKYPLYLLLSAAFTIKQIFCLHCFFFFLFCMSQQNNYKSTISSQSFHVSKNQSYINRKS